MVTERDVMQRSNCIMTESASTCGCQEGPPPDVNAKLDVRHSVVIKLLLNVSKRGAERCAKLKFEIGEKAQKKKQ